MALSPGTPAPEFTLLATPDQSLSLSEFDGPVVLIFYPADWSPVCGDELAMFQAASKLFQARGAQLLGISVDGAWSHTAFRADHGIEFPLLADFQPKGATARAYDVYDEKDGICERALFVVDRDKNVAWSYVSPVGVSPGADGALSAVEALS
jgi:peroxiredoxin